jgi:type I restriction enzyme S subunit
MSTFIEVNPSNDVASLSDSDLVSFVPMTNVQPNTNQVTYETVEYKDVCTGFTVFKRGDLIWAKITPCMQNGKSCIVSDMPTELGFGSTEFHVICKRSNDVYMPFIWAIFSNQSVLKAAQSVFGGSAGQQRVSADFIKQFPAVLPDIKIQVELAEKLEKNLEQFKAKLREADALLAGMDEVVTSLLPLSAGIRRNVCGFAVTLKDLQGVIDPKRHLQIKPQNALCISDVCDILDEKVNPENYGDTIIDWIRIDDLCNRPWDIEEVRTQPASEVTGTFFEVQPNDILVARLGPTILNQKIVIVRAVDRMTIASSEFLVLRCKTDCSPEAVLWVLRTKYYKDLMYSHTRGSTPSRYRLNRDDMLSLPFPQMSEESQHAIASEALTRRTTARALRAEAETEWAAAKARFERELLAGGGE